MESLLHLSSSEPSMSTATRTAGDDVAVDIYQKKDLALEACPSTSPSSIEDESIVTPFIGWITEKSKKNRRRRSNSSGSFTYVPPSRQQSFRRDVGHAAAETYLLTRLSFKLLTYLGVGYRWIIKFLALGLYAILLMPGFLQVGYYYFFSSQVRRSIVYGDQPRNRLDLYLPANLDEPKPVVAFVTGGAWIIGYKAWGALLGLELAERDVIVACIDYRNFPQGTISDMVKDASAGISFVCNNIAEYGGDPNRIYLVGQSAGAHIAACALLDQAFKESGDGENITWSISQIKAYFGISGGYNILNLVDHFHRRGLYRSIFLSIMEGEHDLHRFSPEIMALDPRIRDAVSRLPFILLFHGTADYSIPSDASKTFADALRRVGAKVELMLYEGKTHTDLFLQDPLRGGRDALVEDIVAVIHAGDTVSLAKEAEATHRRRLVPEFMLQLAHKVSPF
ncbi:isoprenylcysteine alpha-carbonyl methylesterase ICME-like [Aristolochia californica]|uniref:isoprenylcysteine alpha-carbonyl methylesterase ICME-like n=1 Tax=Aristolochia californica TaxID=171875 RepID=UPI0035DC2D4E